MRISCHVEISSRSRPSHSSGGKQKSCRASVAIGLPKGAVKDWDQLCVLICTAVNKNGTMYKLKTNVEKLFDKFVSDGRATIRFRTPPHDVLLSQADALQLKSFLKILRASLLGEGVTGLSLPRLTAASTSQLQVPKTKAEFEGKSSYSQATALPSSLKILRIVDCALKRIEGRILRLRQLRVLDLSCNVIEELPTDIGFLNLEELNLSHNVLQTLPGEMWTKNLADSLRTLDLSNNALCNIPRDLCRLNNLEVLKLNNNHLSELPFTLSNLQLLKHLSVANNQLSILPGGIAALHLDTIDISDNPFGAINGSFCVTRSDGCISLLEWAARSVLTNRLQVGEGDVPPHLLDYLSDWKRCVCGRFFVESMEQSLTMFDLHNVSRSVTHSHDASVPIKSILCRWTCSRFST